MISFAMLTGAPIGGALISHDDGGYTYAIIFSGVCTFVGTAFFVLARIARVGTELRKVT